MSFPFDFIESLIDFSPDDIIANQPIITAEDIITQPLDEESSRPRKRERTAASTLLNETGPSAVELSSLLQSNDADDVIGAVNTLLKLSADHDANYALGEQGELVAQALVDIFDEVIGWTRGNSEFFEFDMHDSTDQIITKAWSKQSRVLPLNESHLVASSSWVDFCSIRFAPSSLNTSFTQSHIPPFLTLTAPNDESSAQKIKILEVIIMIIRNLSYVSGNSRFLVQNLGILRILTGALYFRNFITGKTERGPKSEREEDLGNGNSSNNMSLHAVHTILNLAPMLDCTGIPVFLDKMFLNPDMIVGAVGKTGGRTSNTTSDTTDTKTVVGWSGSSYQNSHKNFFTYGQSESWGFGGLALAKRFDQRDDKISTYHDNILNPIRRPYQIATLALVFPLFTDLLGLTTSRAVIISALETLIQLFDCSYHLIAFKSAPDICLYHLVRLLYIPRLGPDSLEYVDPVRNMVSRVSALKLLATYDTIVDYELRDRSLEILTKWTSLTDAAEIKRKLGRAMTISTRPVETADTGTMFYGTTSVVHIHEKVPNAKLYDAVIPCLTTRVGRELTPQLAAKLLANLFSHLDNRIGAEYTENAIIMSASASIVSSLDSAPQALQMTSILCKQILSQTL